MRYQDHAYVPSAALGILTARTLANSHPGLLEHLRPGLSVLDVGCGPGTLTAEIARRVAPAPVVGMDVNLEMIAAAEQASPPDAVPNLVFYRGDIRRSDWEDEFDLVNASRVLQWIPDAGVALAAMARAAGPGGRVMAQDWSHEKSDWSRPPAAWTRFHGAFLEWRAAAGLDNAIADHLPGMLEALGLREVRVSANAVIVRAADPDFFRAAGMWRLVADSRGRQMVSAGVLAEAEREEAVAAYTEWMQTPDATQTMHEASVTGIVDPPPRGKGRGR
jgi:ubiquinone/menaquinone biosynthesis C-methylase UbiE